MIKAKRLLGMVLGFALALGTVSFAMPARYVEAASHGESLDLSTHKIKLNGTTKFTSTAVYESPKEYFFFSPAKTTDVVTTIKTKKTTSGDKVKVKFDVAWDFKDDVKMSSNVILGDDFFWQYTQPQIFINFFDYETGKAIDWDDSDFKLKAGNWKVDYYDKQYFTYNNAEMTEGYGKENLYIALKKSVKNSFTVTYPASNKNVCVAVGYINVKGEEFDENGLTKQAKINKKFNNGKTEYGRTSYYKKGKDSVAYIRLK